MGNPEMWVHENRNEGYMNGRAQELFHVSVWTPLARPNRKTIPFVHIFHRLRPSLTHLTPCVACFRLDRMIGQRVTNANYDMTSHR